MNDYSRTDERCDRCGSRRINHGDWIRSHHFVERRKPKRRAYLRDWTLASNGGKWVSLQGDVYGHDKFMDGSHIITSPVLKLDIPGCSAETMNTIYVLRDDRRPG